MESFIYVMLGGGFGAISRYALVRYIQVTHMVFPWGVLIINVLGSFLMGFIFFLLSGITKDMLHSSVVANIRLFTLIGFLGSFTTFSTYSFETVELLRNGYIVSGLINILSNNLVSLFAVVLGMLSARLVLWWMGGI